MKVEHTARPSRFASPRLELGSAALALLLAPGVAALILLGGAFQLTRGNAAAFFDSTFLGPLLALGGAWIDARLRRPVGLMLLGFAALLALDGMIATYFIGLPLFLLVLLSLIAGVRRQFVAGERERQTKE